MWHVNVTKNSNPAATPSNNFPTDFPGSEFPRIHSFGGFCVPVFFFVMPGGHFIHFWGGQTFWPACVDHLGRNGKHRHCAKLNKINIRNYYTYKKSSNHICTLNKLQDNGFLLKSGIYTFNLTYIFFYHLHQIYFKCIEGDQRQRMWSFAQIKYLLTLL